MENTQYIKNMQKLTLLNFNDYKNLSFSFGATVIIGGILLLNSYSFITKETSTGFLFLGLIYIFSAIFQKILLSKITNSILKTEKIDESTRKLGIFLLPLLFLGNIFAFISGCTIISKNKSIEYQISIFMLLNMVFVMMISLINIFKNTLCDTFWLGMVIFLIIAVFYIITMKMLSKYVNNNSLDAKLKYLIMPLIVSSITGNLFALILALILISKFRQKNKDISIEWIDITKRIFRNYMAVIGLFVVIFLLTISVCSNLVFSYSFAVDNNYSSLFQFPSLMYPFGTDNFGRCVFTRIIFGARISLIVGMAATVLPMITGGILGAMAGYYGGKVDNTIMRVLDIVYAVPSILLAIAIIAAFGVSVINIVLALSVYGIAVYARIVRAMVLSLSNAEFVEAAKACGASNNTIIFKHILPNSTAPIIVRATLEIGSAVLSTSALSYLGIGVAAHIPEWGNILRVGSQYLESNPYLAIFPGLAIITIVLAFNFFGDGLRDALDPKMK